MRDGVIYTNRLRDSDLSNDYLNSKLIRPAPRLTPLGEAGRPVKLSTSAPGMLNKIEFVTDTVYNEPMEDHLVEIEVKAVGLNFQTVSASKLLQGCPVFTLLYCMACMTSLDYQKEKPSLFMPPLVVLGRLLFTWPRMLARKYLPLSRLQRRELYL